MKKVFLTISIFLVLHTSAQNVGIGTTTPQSRLHVRTFSSGGAFHPNATATLESNTINFLQFSNGAGATSGILSGTNLTQQRAGIWFEADSSIRFIAGGTTNYFKLDNNGFVGINHTSPTSRLHVSNGASGNTTSAASRIATFEDNASSYLQLLNPGASESGLLSGNATTLIRSGLIFTPDSGMLLRTGGNNSRIKIDQDGAAIFFAPPTLPASPTLPITGNGNRMVWWADKAALRVGGLSDAVGIIPFAQAGKYTLSAGLNAFASDDYSAAFGLNSVAGGLASFTIGTNCLSAGNYSFAGGNDTWANGHNSFSFGAEAKAMGMNSIAVGQKAVANGTLSSAFGFVDTASGYGSTAFGFGNNAKGDFAFAMGYGLVAKPFGTFAVGRYNEINNSSSTTFSPNAPLFVVGDGDDSQSRSNALEVYQGGSVYLTNISVSGEVISGLKPGLDDNYRLGTSTRRWREVWSANPFLQSSDARLKTNIQPLRYGLQTIMEMQPVSYNMKKNLAQTELGFLAQDMEKIVPEVVVSPEDDGMKAMKYTNLIPVLVQGMKDQQKIIEALEKRIVQLEKELHKKAHH